MDEIILVTDGSADMPENWREKYKVNLLPLWLRFRETSYLQEADITPKLFYELVSKNHEIPKTAFPSPEKMVEYYRNLATNGEQVISLHVASRLSGTFQAVQKAAAELRGSVNLHPIDSGAGSAALGFMCRDIRLLEQAGVSLQKIVQHLNEVRNRLKIVFTVDNLEYARLSGRVNLLQTVLSSLLRVKPIIELKDGQLDVTEKVRTRQRAFDWLVEYSRKYSQDGDFSVAIVHAIDLPAAEYVKGMLEKLGRFKEIVISELAIPVAAHLGPGTIGLVLYPKLSINDFKG